MTAYVVVEIDIADPARYETYKTLAHATVHAHGGKYIVRGAPVETLEGLWRPPRFVMLEFPTIEAARTWWNSPDYAPAKALRQSCAETRMILVQGVS